MDTRSEEFATFWAAQNVRLHASGTKALCHPVVGPLELDFEAMELTRDPGLSLVIYTAKAGSPAEDGLRLLASWSADAAAEPTSASS